ncbi:PorP/SprF family type IX secretion system membrane protein [Nafulsella turpanensis]|uniref:PorP/SprF family type IX secretion system membrane protein n=1 Tax=Nafulsella turpanensis TaxID=1265690 RepID=UPI0003816506|nr:PorP/SprF family type IX secretion system membrane protein [Nafulsella turpanensis]
MNKVFYSLLFIVSLQNFLAKAQDIPPVYSQFYMNPALFNPAFVGSDGYSSLYLTHRRQWVGIEGAPVSSTLNFHTPLSRNFAAGVLINHDQTGIYKASMAEAQFAYIIPMGEQHNLRMGLSTGVSKLNMDLSEASPEQKVYLANRYASGQLFRAKFGINYHFKSLNVGFSTNSLFQNSPLQAKPDEFGFAPLQNMVVNASYYTSLIPEKIHLEPYVLFNRLTDSERIEGGLLFYYMDFIWAGASYRSHYGLTGILGFQAGKVVKMAYAYELGQTGEFGFQLPSHELQINIKLGKNRIYTKEIIRKPRFEMQ